MDGVIAISHGYVLQVVSFSHCVKLELVRREAILVRGVRIGSSGAYYR